MFSIKSDYTTHDALYGRLPGDASGPRVVELASDAEQRRVVFKPSSSGNLTSD